MNEILPSGWRNTASETTATDLDVVFLGTPLENMNDILDGVNGTFVGSPSEQVR